RVGAEQTVPLDLRMPKKVPTEQTAQPDLRMLQVREGLEAQTEQTTSLDLHTPITMTEEVRSRHVAH
ncbi:unnamed protein product, partial [Litomosoides sigmodontis]